MIYFLRSKQCRKENKMDNDNLLSSLSEHIAYWYTSVKGEKDIVFPINNVIKERANQIFRDRYSNANIIISEKGEIYKISKEICCERNTWSYVFYLDDMKKNYRIKKICKETLPYDLKSSNKEKYKIINNLAIPKKTIIIKAKAEDIMQIKKIIEPYLKCFTYINTKDKTIIAYPDVLIVEKEKIKILLNYYHHHHMDRFIRKIKKSLSNYKELSIS